ncbi:MAG TPA: putative glycoside hydrolase, partial [Acidimicrobiales bacterium]
MGSSLRDIPGAGGGKKKGRLGKVARRPAGKPWQPPPKTAGPTRAAKARTGPALRFQGPRWQVDRFNLLLGLAFLALFVIGGIWLVRANRVTVTSDFEDGGAVQTAHVRSLVIDVRIQPANRIEDSTVRLDGTDITESVEITDTGFTWTPPDDGMEEGTYELSVEVPKAVFGIETWSMTFGVDDTPPVLDVPTPERIGIGDELTLSGTVDERVDLTAEEVPVEVDEDGHFSVTFPVPPAGAVDFVATDPAGNATPLSVPVSVAPPSTHGLYLSADAWADESLRDGALALLDDEQVDTVVLDVKDECGVVPFAADVGLAGEVGAVDDRYDLEDAIATVHDHGGQVIARLVTFRDPLLARWAWANGHEDWVLQDTANDPWPVYGDAEGCPAAANAEPIVGGFTNYANAEVWDYNLGLAEEVVGLGADNVLLDDVRRPDGDPAFLNAVGITGTTVETLTAFLAEAQSRVRPEGA